MVNRLRNGRKSWITTSMEVEATGPFEGFVELKLVFFR